MHIPLSRRKVRVTGKLLNRPRLTPLHREMRAEGVAEDVDTGFELCPPSHTQHRPLNHRLREPLTAAVADDPRPSEMARTLAAISEVFSHGDS